MHSLTYCSGDYSWTWFLLFFSRPPTVTVQGKRTVLAIHYWQIDIFSEYTTAWDNGKAWRRKTWCHFMEHRVTTNSISCDVTTVGRACATGQKLTIIRHFQLRWPLLHLFTFFLYSCQKVLSLSVLNDVELNGSAKGKQKEL